MKHLFFSFQLRQLLAVSAIGLCFAGTFELAQRPLHPQQRGWPRPFGEAEREREEEGEDDADRPRADRPDEAVRQDAALTRDPATGTVPTERLLAAARFNEKALQQAAQRGTATTGLSNAAWVERGPTNVGGRILALLVEPSDATGNTVWAGTAGGGLWKATSANTAGAQWTNVNSQLSNLAVAAVAADPGTSVRYLGTGEGFYGSASVQGAGLWKSTNAGATWTQLPGTANSNFYYTQKIVVHPVTHDVYAATRAGLWRSQNGGTTWAQVLSLSTSPASVSNRVADLEIAADNTLFVAFGIFSTDGIYRSATGNVGSWTNLNTLAGSGLPTTGYERIEVACAPSDANRVYAAFQSSAADTPVLGVYRSLNKGTTWEALPMPTDADTGIGNDYSRGQSWYDLPLGVSPTDPNTLWVGGIDLFKTTNGGAAPASAVSWQQVTHWYGGFGFQNVHADQHAIVFPDGNGSKVYFGNDGGFFFSTNPNAAVPALTAGNTRLNVTQFYAVAMHPTNANYFLAGAQDNGSQQFTAAGANTTTEVTGGDGAFCAIDQDNPAVQFTSYVYNDYYRSTDGGATFTEFYWSGTAGSFINPWEYDSKANVLYARWSGNNYMAWYDAGDPAGVGSAQAISLGTGSGSITHITVSPLTNNRLYVGTDAGKILRVDNANPITGTPAVTTLRTGTAGTSVSCVAVDPANENHLLATYSNYGIVSVYETTNGGTTWATVEGNLPDMPVRWALFDPRGTSRALLATEMGVYATDRLNGASTVWNPTTNGPLNVRVDMLRYRPGDKLVAAATHGRGLFTSAMFALPLPVTLTSLAAVRQSSGAVVRWQTASEQHALRFEVERSMNAVDYQQVGSVAAAGNSSGALSYSLADATAGLGAYYYRLRQVDADGTFTYSAPVLLAAAAGAGNALLSSLYPNPFRTSLSVELAQPATGSAALELVDAQGRRAWAGTVPATGRELQVAIPATVAPGTYLLTVRANGQLARRRVVKE